ncbi:MAG: LysM domain-containing protein [Acidimicrobiales bacterium]|nr:LysM peptidoglycan-binding domain-containing protein [Acidimicrobiales bacterium]
MAAIIETRSHHRHLGEAAGRPALRLVASDGRRTDVVPVDLGIRTVHLVVAVAAFALLLVISLAIGNGTFAGLSPAPSAPSATAGAIGGRESAAAATVEVRAGDSLWTIARRLQPSGDIRPLVDRLVELNGPGALQVGQVVQVPA